MKENVAVHPKTGARQKLLEAAAPRIRDNGYSATTVDQLCADAGVTKGAFFHHFKSKDALAIATADYWAETTDALFLEAPFHKYKDPLDRLLGYLDFRRSLFEGEIMEFTCLFGTMVQEVYKTHPEINKVYGASILAHAEKIELEIAEAMKAHRIRAKWTAASLGIYTQAVLQGAFIIAKATGNAELAAANVDHLRRYVELLFAKSRGRNSKPN